MPPDGIVEIQGGYWCLRDCKQMTPRCRKAGRIDYDEEVRFTLLHSYEFRQAYNAPNKLAIDAGASIGDTVKFLQDSKFRVVAFEPLNLAFQCLQHNCPGSHNINRAVGDGRKVKWMNQEDYSNWGSNYYMDVPEADIETYRLDDLEVDRVDFLKIDVEGNEPYVLDGAQKLMERFKPVLYIEINKHVLNRMNLTEADIFNRIPSFYHCRPITWPERIGHSEPWDLICFKGPVWHP